MSQDNPEFITQSMPESESPKEPVETEIKPLGPRIIYEKSLLEPDTPYTVRVNGSVLGYLLKGEGMPEKDIDSLVVSIRRKPGGLNLAGKTGDYNPATSTMTIYTEPVWMVYERSLRKARLIAEGRLRPSPSSFENLLITKRLPLYLTKVPSERGKKFAQRLFSQATGRSSATDIAHEMKHALDFNPDLRDREIKIPDPILEVGLPLIAGGSFWITVMGILKMMNADPWTALKLECSLFPLSLSLTYVFWSLGHRFSPLEKRARKFSEAVGHDPRWLSVVEFRPRPPEDPRKVK